NTFISDDSFADLFFTPEWEKVNKLFIMDTCFAGGFWGRDPNPVRPGGDDLHGLSRAALIGSSPESSTSTSKPAAGGLYLGILEDALVGTLNNFGSSTPFTFQNLYDGIVARGAAFVSLPNGKMRSGFDVAQDASVQTVFNPVAYATPDFNFTA